MSTFYKKDKLKHGLPASAYTDVDFFRTECDTLFTNNWVFVGFAHELPETGTPFQLQLLVSLLY